MRQTKKASEGVVQDQVPEAGGVGGVLSARERWKVL